MPTSRRVGTGIAVIALSALWVGTGGAMPPLHTAIQRGDTTRAIELASQGKKVEIMTLSGATPLQLAAGRGQLGVVRALVARGVKINRATPAFGTALHQAALEGHAEVIRYLVANGATVDPCNAKQATPLYVAALKGHESAAEALLELGADPNAALVTGQTPLHAAAIPQEGKHGVPLARLLMRHGADPRRGDDEGWTALHVSVQAADSALARALVAGGADLGARGGGGHTPLDFAVLRGDSVTACALLDIGARPRLDPGRLDVTAAARRLKADWHLGRGERDSAAAELRLAADCLEAYARHPDGVAPSRGGAVPGWVEGLRGTMMDGAFERRDGGTFGAMWALGLNAKGTGRGTAGPSEQELKAEAERLRERAARLDAAPAPD